jgi:hypothetical protein
MMLTMEPQCTRSVPVPLFDVQTQREGTWVTQVSGEDKEEALETAKRLFGNKACTGIRVMQTVTKADGVIVETEIYSETRMVKVSDAIRSSKIDWAPPPCTNMEEFYGSTSRRLIGRVLRDYCDKIVVTPTEILYNIKEALRLEDKGGLIQGAIDKIAALQGGTNPARVKKRNEALTQTVEQMISRARKADKLALPKISNSFAAAMVACTKIETQGEDTTYVAMSVLARDLSAIRNWLGKLHRLSKLADQDQDNPVALAILDGVIADCLAGAVVQDILGYQINLASAILAMIDLSEGKLVPEKSDAGDAAGIINRLCGQGKLPETRQSLLERAHRQLSGTNPLSRNDADRERDEFKRVLDRLVRPNGLYSGPETAEALTLRYNRLLEKGGVSGRRAAFNGLFFLIPDRTGSIHYMCDLARTLFAEDCAEDIVEKYDTILNLRSFMELGRQGLGIKERMQRLTAAHKAIAASTFPDDIKAKLMGQLVGLLDRYVNEVQMLDKIDSPTAPVKDRAMILVQFCSAGMLPPGKTLASFRERLKNLTSQPDFDTQFVSATADPEQAQKALLTLKQLLIKSGIR